MASLGAIADIADAKLKGEQYTSYLDNALRSGDIDIVRGYIDHGGFDFLRSDQTRTLAVIRLIDIPCHSSMQCFLTRSL